MGFSNSKDRINESNTNHAPFIPETISDKLYNSIVRIEIKSDNLNVQGTGFFIFINNKYLLMTCNHIISNDIIDSKKEVTLYFGKKEKEKNKIILLDNKIRYIKSFENPIDVTVIEIIKGDKIEENKFLFPDLNYKNGYKIYDNQFFYLAGYPNNGSLHFERCISSGKIAKIIDHEFEHTLDTRVGSSGSPICNRDNISIIGIHKSGNKSEQVNYGLFIGYIIDELEKEEKKEDKFFVADSRIRKKIKIKIKKKKKNQIKKNLLSEKK